MMTRNVFGVNEFRQFFDCTLYVHEVFAVGAKAYVQHPVVERSNSASVTVLAPVELTRIEDRTSILNEDGLIAIATVTARGTNRLELLDLLDKRFFLS
jgi:hypothetical protein